MTPDPKYREYLVDALRRAQWEYDKTVLMLSGGALGISFAFIEKVAKDSPLHCAAYLFWAWMCWGTSVACVLTSFLTSQWGFRKAIEQIDSGETDPAKLGGSFTRATLALNFGSGFLFVTGVVLIALFAHENLGR